MSLVPAVEIIGLCVLVVIMMPNYNCVPIEGLSLKRDFIAVTIICSLLIWVSLLFFIIKTLDFLRLVGMHRQISRAHRAHTPHITHIFEC